MDSWESSACKDIDELVHIANVVKDEDGEDNTNGKNSELICANEQKPTVKNVHIRDFDGYIRHITKINTLSDVHNPNGNQKDIHHFEEMLRNPHEHIKVEEKNWKHSTGFSVNYKELDIYYKRKYDVVIDEISKWNIATICRSQEQLYEDLDTIEKSMHKLICEEFSTYFCITTVLKNLKEEIENLHDKISCVNRYIELLRDTIMNTIHLSKYNQMKKRCIKKYLVFKKFLKFQKIVKRLKIYIETRNFHYCLFIINELLYIYNYSKEVTSYIYIKKYFSNVNIHHLIVRLFENVIFLFCFHSFCFLFGQKKRRCNYIRDITKERVKYYQGGDNIYCRDTNNRINTLSPIGNLNKFHRRDKRKKRIIYFLHKENKKFLLHYYRRISRFVKCRNKREKERIISHFFVSKGLKFPLQMSIKRERNRYNKNIAILNGLFTPMLLFNGLFSHLKHFCRNRNYINYFVGNAFYESISEVVDVAHAGSAKSAGSIRSAGSAKRSGRDGSNEHDWHSEKFHADDRTVELSSGKLSLTEEESNQSFSKKVSSKCTCINRVNVFYDVAVVRKCREQSVLPFFGRHVKKDLYVRIGHFSIKHFQLFLNRFYNRIKCAYNNIKEWMAFLVSKTIVCISNKSYITYVKRYFPFILIYKESVLFLMERKKTLKKVIHLLLKYWKWYKTLQHILFTTFLKKIKGVFDQRENHDMHLSVKQIVSLFGTILPILSFVHKKGKKLWKSFFHRVFYVYYKCCNVSTGDHSNELSSLIGVPKRRIINKMGFLPFGKGIIPYIREKWEKSTFRVTKRTSLLRKFKRTKWWKMGKMGKMGKIWEPTNSRGCSSDSSDRNRRNRNRNRNRDQGRGSSGNSHPKDECIRSVEKAFLHPSLTKRRGKYRFIVLAEKLKKWERTFCKSKTCDIPAVDEIWYIKKTFYYLKKEAIVVINNFYEFKNIQMKKSIEIEKWEIVNDIPFEINVQMKNLLAIHNNYKNKVCLNDNFYYMTNNSITFLLILLQCTNYILSLPFISNVIVLKIFKLYDKCFYYDIFHYILNGHAVTSNNVSRITIKILALVMNHVDFGFCLLLRIYALFRCIARQFIRQRRTNRKEKNGDFNYNGMLSLSHNQRACFNSSILKEKKGATLIQTNDNCQMVGNKLFMENKKEGIPKSEERKKIARSTNKVVTTQRQKESTQSFYSNNIIQSDKKKEKKLQQNIPTIAEEVHMKPKKERKKKLKHNFDDILSNEEMKAHVHTLKNTFPAFKKSLKLFNAQNAYLPVYLLLPSKRQYIYYEKRFKHTLQKLLILKKKLAQKIVDLLSTRFDYYANIWLASDNLIKNEHVNSGSYECDILPYGMQLLSTCKVLSIFLCEEDTKNIFCELFQDIANRFKLRINILRGRNKYKQIIDRLLNDNFVEKSELPEIDKLILYYYHFELNEKIIPIINKNVGDKIVIDITNVLVILYKIPFLFDVIENFLTDFLQICRSLWYITINPFVLLKRYRK
ncbi:conserved Plasmodium protein, unknown function [Plasmodium ovale]|uniref:Vacuolar protein sorting-associated protein 54 C-terminal domain-containing protein n=1 Tax=Plasmodium ovale TaxID=36330 RepID=A0A1D3UAV3_PLAOA|nr:conserved Plasmodium protein, unknown function [Plasmodium ovale]